MQIRIFTSLKQHAALGLILVLAVFALGYRLDKPFYGYHDWNGVTYGQIARNYVRYGYLATRLGQVENLTPVEQSVFRYDTHFPPLFTLLLSLPVSLLGSSEAVIRLLPLILSLPTLVLIYKLGASWANQVTGLMAAILALFTPVFLYFGKNPVHETLILPFLLLETLLFYQTLTGPAMEFSIRFRQLLVVSTLSLFSGWPAYYPFFAMAVIGFISTHRRLWLGMILVPFVTLGFHFLHVRLLTGSFTGGGLGEIIGYRLGISPLAQTHDRFTLLEFGRRFFLFSRNMFTLPLLLTTLGGFIVNRRFWPYLLVLATGLLHPVIFANAGWLHDYLQLPFLGFVALSSALFLRRFVPIRFFFLVGLILALVSLWTKWPFTNAMLDSYMSQSEYDLVLTKIAPLKPGQSLNLGAKDARLLRGVVTPYYLQLEVEYTDESASTYRVTRLPDKLVVTP